MSNDENTQVADSSPVTDDHDVLSRVVCSGKGLVNPEKGNLARQSGDRLFQRHRSRAPLGSRRIHRHRNGKIQILAQAIESGMHFGEARSTFEYQRLTRRRQILQEDRTEIILLDEPRLKCRGMRCEVDCGWKSSGSSCTGNGDSRLFIEYDSPAAVERSSLRTRRNPWNEAGRRLERPLQLPQQRSVHPLAFKQRADAPNGARVAITQRDFNREVPSEIPSPPFHRPLRHKPAN